MSDELQPSTAAPDIPPTLPEPPAAARPPRVWTVFVTFVAAIVGLVTLQIVVAVAAVFWMLALGTRMEQLAPRVMEVALSPEGVVGLSLLPTQIALLLTAIAAAWLSPQPLTKRLGMTRPRASAAIIVTWIVAAIVPFAVGMGAAHALARYVPVIPVDPTVAKLYEKMRWEFAGPFVLFIALAPGLAEELLFRGYVQRRLIQRWPVWLGILVTTVLFAVLHLMPHAVLFAFVIGLWLGLIAWRTDSVWPSVACHALVNGLWNVWQIGRAWDAFPDQFPVLLLLTLGALGTAAFGFALWDLARFRRPEQAAT